VEPAVRCLECEFAWRSRAMAEGLAALGSCPKCGGALRFAGSPDLADAPPNAPEPRLDRRAPHRVMGIPRR
jgi:hypothetical protein